MRKFALLGLLILSSGCNHDWLPLFRGAPCTSNCGLNAAPPALPPAYSPGCANCPPAAMGSAGFGSYENSGIVSDNYYNQGTIVSDGYSLGSNGYYPAPSEGVIVSPSMTNIQPAP